VHYSLRRDIEAPRLTATVVAGGLAELPTSTLDDEHDTRRPLMRQMSTDSIAALA
jgi:hypothetical protein